jgi:D-sedoheptulose 7-phosphate isomerase
MKEIAGVQSYFGFLSSVIGNLPFETIEKMAEILLQAFETEHTVYPFGNGGSAALASHFACDLGKGTIQGNGKRLRAVALTDNISLMTAWANDSNYENVFAEQMTNLIREGDVAFAISGSGNSPNVLKALEVARRAGATTLGLTGFRGGKMKELCDVCVVVPSDNMQIIEDLHLCTAHAVFTAVRRRMCVTAAAAFA